MQGFAGGCAADVVHPRLEMGIATLKTLQAAAHTGLLFEHDHLVTDARQHGGGR